MVKHQLNSMKTSEMEVCTHIAETSSERTPPPSGQAKTSSTAMDALLSSLSQSTLCTKESHTNNAPSATQQHSQCRCWQTMGCNEWILWHHKYKAESDKQDRHELKCLLLAHSPSLQSARCPSSHTTRPRMESKIVFDADF